MCGYLEKDRVIPVIMERAYRLVSGEFEGKTREEAAKELGVTPEKVTELLCAMREKAPQLFPLLTKNEAGVYGLLKVGWTYEQVAEVMQISTTQVHRYALALKTKGRKWPGMSPVVTERYDPSMEPKIKEKF